ncbi:calcium binding EGF domain protein [Trichuris suis]|nr:calcium binding EGF domain protein [Trichuris suis]
MVDCGRYGTCIISRNFPTCKCNESIATGAACENIADINECHFMPCGESGTCFNTFGSYMCTCADGQTGNTCKHVEGQVKVKAHEKAVYGSIGGMLVFIVLTIMAIIYQCRKKKMVRLQNLIYGSLMNFNTL